MTPAQPISHPYLPLKKGFLISSLMHLFIVGLVLFVPKIPLFKPKVKVVWVDIPKGISEEIDIKIKESPALPETTIKEQKEWQKEPIKEEGKKPLVAPKPEPKPTLRPIQPVPKPKPHKQTEVEKALAALNKRRPAPPEAAQVKEQGEGFKYGLGTEPLRVPPTDPEYIAYQAKVRFKIIQEWILPQAYLEGGIPPRTRIVVHINERGEITSQEWEAKSGNNAFDSSCERAVARATPLPLPPERLKWEAYNEGFLVEFDPSLKGQQ